MRAATRPLWCAAMCLVMLSFASSSAAQEAVVVSRGASSERIERWEQRVADQLSPGSFDSAVLSRERVGSFEPARLAVFTRIEEALATARAAAARLDEGAAVGALALASTLARNHLDVPGMSVWYAEVQLLMALVATQAGQVGLGEASLRRAASLEPSRGVLAAEARPELVRHARAVYRAAATAPRGRFEMQADVPGAVVFLDDRRLGALPRTVEGAVGPHVLRVEAAGHRAWAQLVTILEGDRAPVQVRLSPTPALAAARTARIAAREGDLGRVSASLGVVGAEASMLVLYPSRATDRALLVRCTAEGCGGATRVEGGPLATGPGGALSPALAWLDRVELPDVHPAPPWWERWELWTVVAGVVLVGAVVLTVLAQPQGDPPLRVIVDPSGLD